MRKMQSAAILFAERIGGRGKTKKERQFTKAMQLSVSIIRGIEMCTTYDRRGNRRHFEMIPLTGR